MLVLASLHLQLHAACAPHILRMWFDLAALLCKQLAVQAVLSAWCFGCTVVTKDHDWCLWVVLTMPQRTVLMMVLA